MLLFSSAYNEYTVISKEYTGPLDFDITGVDCVYIYMQGCLAQIISMGAVFQICLNIF